MAESQRGGRVTKQLLKSRSGEFDIESIHSLVLRNSDIDDLGCISECAGLERLDLSQNDITKLYSLAGLTNLVHLNLSANRISSLEGLQSLDNLVSLNLSGNLISGMDTLHCITGLENLQHLRLKDGIHSLYNPVCMSNSYKNEILQMFPKLSSLDGERISGKGSEVYKMAEELDKLIETCSDQLSNIGPESVEPWTTNDFWEHKKVKQFEQTDLGNMEQQFLDLMTQCKTLSKEADEKLNTVIESLNSGKNGPDKGKA